MDGTEIEMISAEQYKIKCASHFSVVQIVEGCLQAAEGDHAGSGADHEVVGVVVAGLLLSLRPDCPRQQYMPLLDFEI